METQLNMKLYMNYFQKDNWAHLLKCWGAINLSYNIFHLWQSFFIFSSSHNTDTIFYLFQLCGWTIQKQHPFWRKTQSAVKFVTKNFHQTLVSIYRGTFFLNETTKSTLFNWVQNMSLNLIKIFVTFSFESSHLLFLSQISYLSKHHWYFDQVLRRDI